MIPCMLFIVFVERISLAPKKLGDKLCILTTLSVEIKRSRLRFPVKNLSQHRVSCRRPNDEIRYIKAVAKVFRDEQGTPIRMLGTNIDITDRKHLQFDLERQAHIDYLTGVNNRRHFMALAELELNRSIRYGNPLSIFMMDIDYFKKINDSHGHKIGDVAL